MTRTEMKLKALQLMRNMQIDDDIVHYYEMWGTVPFFERGRCYFKNHLLLRTIRDRIDRYEHEHGFLIYAVTHDFTFFGEFFSFLFVSKYEEDWAVSYGTDGKVHRVYAYVWNVDVEHYSEIGSVYFKTVDGCLFRVG